MIRFLPLFLSAIATCSAQHQWETVVHKGEDYVTARSIKTFYRFDTLDLLGNNRFALENKVVKCSFPTEGTDAVMNGIRFHLEAPTTTKGERLLVSRLTLAKTIDPVLRPVSIARQACFEELIIHPEIMPRGHQGGDLTLLLAQALQQDLKKRGIKATLTRNQAQAPEREKTLALINRPAKSTVLILRLIDDPGEPAGLRTWVMAPTGAPAHDGKPAAKDHREQPGNRHDAHNIALASSIHGSVLLATRRPDRGIARSRDPLLAASERPAFILQFGNLADADDAALLPREAFQHQLAAAISGGFERARRALQPRK